MDRIFKLWQSDESKHSTSCSVSGSLKKKSCVTRHHSEIEHNKSNVHFSGKYEKIISNSQSESKC